MKYPKIIPVLLVALTSGCSYFFPDKEKDYIYSREIAPLEIPPDLKTEKLEAQQDLLGNTQQLTHTVDYVREDTRTFLRIQAPFPYVWRIVGKALTARELEITDKDRNSGLYYVQYDPDVQEVKDGSFWNEVVFFFGEDANQEVPYQIFIQANGNLMHIFVQDAQGQPLSTGNGEKLLQLLYNAIKKDFAE